MLPLILLTVFSILGFFYFLISAKGFKSDSLSVKMSMFCASASLTLTFVSSTIIVLMYNKVF